MKPRPLAIALTLAGVLACRPASALADDNAIDWSQVSHLAWLDRRPLCPIGGEAFDVRFQTARGDVSSALLWYDDGSTHVAIAQRTGSRGPYDRWSARISATAAPRVRYHIQLFDGTASGFWSVSGYSAAPPADGGFVVDFATLSHAPYGATPVTPGGVVFHVWAPHAATAQVRGPFNNWGPGNSMTRVDSGFVAYVANATDRQQYKYYFDDGNWQTDPRAREIDTGAFNNAFIENPLRYAWGDSSFQPAPVDQWVIEQVAVGLFSGRNDPYGATPFPSRFSDVTARVGHLVDLGVNAVLLNPVTQTSGNILPGYDPSTAWSVGIMYGSPDDFRQMVDTLHRNGIAVILDIVWNHFSGDNVLHDYDGSPMYFSNPPTNTPWGPQADFGRPEVRDYFLECAATWLDEYHVDGFRFDAAGAMGYPGSDGWLLMQQLNDLVDRRWRDKPVIAEYLGLWDEVTGSTATGGAGFDAQYHWEFQNAVRRAAQDAVAGDPHVSAIGDALQGSLATGNRSLNYVELHDEAWSYGRLVTLLDPTPPHASHAAQSLAKLSEGLTLVASGIPAFLMGTEWLDDTPFGRDIGNRIDWSRKASHAPVLRFFTDLIAARRTAPRLWAGAGLLLHHVDEARNVLAFERYDDAITPLVVVANFGRDSLGSYRLGMPSRGTWYEVFNSEAPLYGGAGFGNAAPFFANGPGADGFPYSASVDVPAMGFLILSPTRTLDVVADARPSDALWLAPVTPNPTHGRVELDVELPRAAEVRITVHDIAGRRVARLADGAFPAGPRHLAWEATGDDGRALAPGVYLVHVSAGSATASRRFVMVR